MDAERHRPFVRTVESTGEGNWPGRARADRAKPVISSSHAAPWSSIRQWLILCRVVVIGTDNFDLQKLWVFELDGVGAAESSILDVTLFLNQDELKIVKGHSPTNLLVPANFQFTRTLAPCGPRELMSVLRTVEDVLAMIDLVVRLQGAFAIFLAPAEHSPSEKQSVNS